MKVKAQITNMKLVAGGYVELSLQANELKEETIVATVPMLMIEDFRLADEVQITVMKIIQPQPMRTVSQP